MSSYALVLLGYSGIGKDTIFREINASFPSCAINVKFSALSKRLVADAFGVGSYTLEDKEFRSTYKYTNFVPLTPMDLITVLFKGSEQVPAFIQAGMDYVSLQLDAACGDVPVFTDVRRHAELEFIRDKFTRVDFVALSSPNVDAGVNDGTIDKLVDDYGADVIYIRRVEHNPKLTLELIYERTPLFYELSRVHARIARDKGQLQ